MTLSETAWDAQPELFRLSTSDAVHRNHLHTVEVAGSNPAVPILPTSWNRLENGIDALTASTRSKAASHQSSHHFAPSPHRPTIRTTLASAACFSDGSMLAYTSDIRWSE